MQQRSTSIAIISLGLPSQRMGTPKLGGVLKMNCTDIMVTDISYIAHLTLCLKPHEGKQREMWCHVRNRTYY
jgi:hypothetical protein